eukprot:1152655-Pelagomonas_calceolata.AAC.1
MGKAKPSPESAWDNAEKMCKWQTGVTQNRLKCLQSKQRSKWVWHVSIQKHLNQMCIRTGSDPLELYAPWLRQGSSECRSKSAGLNQVQIRRTQFPTEATKHASEAQPDALPVIYRGKLLRAMELHHFIRDVGRPLFVWHPMKTGGTSLCQALLQVSQMHSTSESERKMTRGHNCKIMNTECERLMKCTGVVKRCLHRSFVFYEPSWIARKYFATFPLPTFLLPGSLTYLTYRHIFLIRHPVDRVVSLMDFLRLPALCKMNASTFLFAFFSGETNTTIQACKVAFTVFAQHASNVYVQHLTGTQNDLKLAKLALSFMTTIDLSSPCSVRQLESLAPGLTLGHIRSYRGNHSTLDSSLLSMIGEKVAIDLDLFQFHQNRSQDC